jgi:hypothetical protein
MSFINILKNPNLLGCNDIGTRLPSGYYAIDIEMPDHWELAAYPKADDGDVQKLPGSLRKREGYALHVQHWKWEGGYLQRDIELKFGQRYLCKAVFQLDVDIANIDFIGDGWKEAVEWQFVIHADGQAYRSPWMQTNRASGKLRKIEEALFVVQPARDMTVAYQFLLRSRWGNVLGDITHHALRLEQVPATYGTPMIIG